MYQIRKGWPSDHALDETVKAEVGATVTEGMIAALSDGYAKPAEEDDELVSFIIGAEPMTGTLTALLGGFIVEVDDAHYVPGSYAAKDKLYAAAGKFTKTATGTSPVVIGQVLRVITSGTETKLRILWRA